MAAPAVAAGVVLGLRILQLARGIKAARKLGRTSSIVGRRWYRRSGNPLKTEQAGESADTAAYPPGDTTPGEMTRSSVERLLGRVDESRANVAERKFLQQERREDTAAMRPLGRVRTSQPHKQVAAQRRAGPVAPKIARPTSAKPSSTPTRVKAPAPARIARPARMPRGSKPLARSRYRKYPEREGRRGVR